MTQTNKNKIEFTEGDVILRNNIYLKLVCGVEGGSKKVSTIVKYINEQINGNELSSNKYKYLDKLVKLKILNLDSFNKRKRIIEWDTKKGNREVRSNMYFSLNYNGLAEFFFNELLLKKMERYDISVSTKESVKEEMMSIFPALIQKYLVSVKKYLNLKI